MRKNMETKVILTDETAPPNYECVRCDFRCYEERKAIKHQEETSHEMWVKRR
jgi:hypothetical protein